MLIWSSPCHALSYGETLPPPQPEKQMGFVRLAHDTLRRRNNCEPSASSGVRTLFFNFENVFLTQFGCCRYAVLERDKAIFTCFLQRQLTFYVTSEILPQNRADHLHNVGLVLTVTASLRKQMT